MVLVLDEAKINRLTVRELNEQLAKYRLLEADRDEKFVPMEKDLGKKKHAWQQAVKEAAGKYMRTREWEEDGLGADHASITDSDDGFIE